MQEYKHQLCVHVIPHLAERRAHTSAAGRDFREVGITFICLRCVSAVYLLMKGNEMISTYYDQLLTATEKRGVDLKEAVLHAGIPDSTYYRWINNTSNHSIQNTLKVYESIIKLGK